MKKSSKEVILAGITAAYVFDVNEYRESLLAHNLKKNLINSGKQAEIVLFNDDIDALNARHIRILSKQFPEVNYQEYEGLPLYMVPSPIKGFDSLSEYSLFRYVDFLQTKGVEFDKVINSSQIRKTANFKEISNHILEKKDVIVENLKHIFGLDYSSKFVKYFDGNRYQTSMKTSIFKFPWAIECIVRWLLTGATHEFFSKNYLTKPYGSYYVSEAILTEVFPKTQPAKAHQYEYLNFEKKLIDSLKLLPDEVYVKLLIEKPKTITHITYENVIKELKKYKVKYSSKNWFEVLSFLKYFPKEVLDEDFITKLELYYFNAPLEKKEFSRLVQKSRMLIDKDIIPEINCSLTQTIISKAICCKKLDMNFIEFKELMKKELSELEKVDYLYLNKKLYGTEKGLPLSTYFYFMPKYFLEFFVSNNFKQTPELVGGMQ